MIKDYLNVQHEDKVSLNIFWRIILIPPISIWFMFQLFVLSGMGGIFTIFLGVFGILMNLPYKNKREDNIESLMFILMPIISPFIWLWRYFRFGEFACLMD